MKKSSSTVKTRSTKTPTGRSTKAPTGRPKKAPTPPAVATGEDAAIAAAGAAGAAVTTVGMPPKVTLPVPPKGYVAPPPAAYRTAQPKTAMVMLIPAVVSELKAFTNYESLLGGSVPSATDIATGLTTAGAWTSTLKSSQTWSSYVRPNEGLAWKAILPKIDTLKGAFAIAVATNPGLAEQYPSLAGFLGLGKAVATRGAATRKKNATAKALAAAKAAAVPTPVTTPPADSPAPPATPAAAPNAAVVVMAKS